MVQPNLKKLVAYSSVSHLGFVVLGILSLSTHFHARRGLPNARAWNFPGALFLLVGMLYDRSHTFESANTRLATPMPEAGRIFLFVALSSLGLPMLNGFVANT